MMTRYDDGTVVADATFIRRPIETEYGFDFDAGLTPAQRSRYVPVPKAA